MIDRLGQSEHARKCFWYPLSIATLNDEPEVSSAQLLAEVLKRAFFSRRRDSAFVYSRVGLSELYCTGAKQLIERAGGSVVSHSIAEMLELGAGGRVAIGTGVIGGMLTATVLAVFLVPVFFVSIRSMFGERRKHGESSPSPVPPLSPSPASES